MSLPSKMISSLFLDCAHVTPGYILTRRIKRSPKKLRTSTNAPFSLMTVLMGKWAYTKRILYLNPLVTPLIKFLMCDETVRTAATSFFVPNHFSILIFLLLILTMSTRECLKLRLSTPRGPLTVTMRDLTNTSTKNKHYSKWDSKLRLIDYILPFSGISTYSVDWMTFILEYSFSFSLDY